MASGHLINFTVLLDATSEKGLPIFGPSDLARTSETYLVQVPAALRSGGDVAMTLADNIEIGRRLGRKRALSARCLIEGICSMECFGLLSGGCLSGWCPTAAFSNGVPRGVVVDLSHFFCRVPRL